MNKLTIFAAIIFVALTIVSCSKSENPVTPPPPDDNLINLGTQSGNGMTIVLYSDKNPFVGFNKLFLKVTDDASGNIVTNAIVTIMPLLNTGTTNYSAPFENPSGTSAADGKFSGAVVFIMPSSRLDY